MLSFWPHRLHCMCCPLAKTNALQNLYHFVFATLKYIPLGITPYSHLPLLYLLPSVHSAPCFQSDLFHSASQDNMWHGLQKPVCLAQLTHSPTLRTPARTSFLFYPLCTFPGPGVYIPASTFTSCPCLPTLLQAVAP